jgi:site-specific recombinase XerD
MATGHAFHAWLTADERSTDVQEIGRRDIEDYLNDLAARVHQRNPGKKIRPATVAKHYRNLQQLYRFLVHEEIIEHSPFEKLAPPMVPEQPVPIMTIDEIKRLLEACKGAGFTERRDTAIIRLLLDSGIRVSELIGIKVSNLDFTSDTVRLLGKGRRERTAVFGTKPAKALRRYLPVRAQHPKAHLEALWIAPKGPMTDSGVRQMLERRGQQAGVQGVHPHRFRHQFAHDWLADGNGETDLIRLAGWRSGRCYAATQRVQPTSGRGRPTAGRASGTGCRAKRQAQACGLGPASYSAGGLGGGLRMPSVLAVSPFGINGTGM